MQGAEGLRKKVISRAVRNIKRGYADDESTRGMFRAEIRLDLQRSRLMTESFKETDGQPMSSDKCQGNQRSSCPR